MTGNAAPREPVAYDLIIVGGGMVGAALAAALAPTPMRIAVVEARSQADQPSSDGRRVSALTAGSLRILQGLGVQDRVVAADSEPIQGMVVWDGDRAGTITFSAEEAGLESLGAMAPNGAIAAALQAATVDSANVDWYCPAAWREMSREADRVVLTVEAGGERHQLRASLVVGADGRDSALRRHAGIPTVGWSYGQSAVVAEIHPQRPHRGRAFQRFLRGGPVALLPLSRGRSSLVWSVPQARAEGLLDLDEEAFAGRLQRAFGPELGKLAVGGPRAAFPLRLEHARRYMEDRMVLVGDAAHAVHPLAGLGLNLGLRDSAQLAQTLAEAHIAGEDPGSRAVLARYQRARRPDNWLVSAYTDGFHRLFANDSRMLSDLRSLGLGLVDRSGPLKRLLMRQGMGVLGAANRLARGKPLGTP
ncbi:UbiH/UbiF/VisC/COQ6 family ubiquinone biosynthesis hydroxylase [Thiohalorhabdus methylotrophus]|uniref:UbiH/UbiF/VisC/COQ6 family ubiquinone biosynthesis hydroxylase n=1 Tax=Thiohalorhabdus methylotrophus TaxID=3242694 RepID=A0ABV4TQA6_9GAMM